MLGGGGKGGVCSNLLFSLQNIYTLPSPTICKWSTSLTSTEHRHAVSKQIFGCKPMWQGLLDNVIWRNCKWSLLYELWCSRPQKNDHRGMGAVFNPHMHPINVTYKTSCYPGSMRLHLTSSQPWTFLSKQVGWFNHIVEIFWLMKEIKE